MPAPDAITCDKLAKLIGTPRCPLLVDVRAEPLKDGLVGETRCALKGQGCGYG